MGNNELESIQGAIRLIKLVRDIDPWAKKIAVEAMQKQIPKKPKMSLDAYWTCPICGREVEHPFEYCMSCGQAIDWTDNE